MKKREGITLIALVITVIIMLILAAVGINLAFGQEGLFKKALSGQEKTLADTAKERLQSEYASLIIEVHTEGKQLSAVATEMTAKADAIARENSLTKEGTLTGTADGFTGSLKLKKGSKELVVVEPRGAAGEEKKDLKIEVKK